MCILMLAVKKYVHQFLINTAVECLLFVRKGHWPSPETTASMPAMGFVYPTPPPDFICHLLHSPPFLPILSSLLLFSPVPFSPLWFLIPPHFSFSVLTSLFTFMPILLSSRLIFLFQTGLYYLTLASSSQSSHALGLSTCTTVHTIFNALTYFSVEIILGGRHCSPQQPVLF